jgi:ketoreductase
MSIATEANTRVQDRLSGRVVFVTGGTSGIGLAVARSLGLEGASIFLGARTAEDVTVTVKNLRSEGIDAAGQAFDVRAVDEVRAAVAAAAELFGRIDVLVNNAGRGGGGVFPTITDELWDDVVETNLNSVFRVTREVLTTGKMADGPTGRIINIASTGGKQGVLYATPYSASKHGVIGLTKALGQELAKTGITVNAVCPGYVETPMAQGVRQGYAEHWGITEDAVLEQFQAKIPLGRYSTPEEVAGLVQYLVSDTAASITAQAMNVCGGLGNY